jgi:zinc transport system permease protein
MIGFGAAVGLGIAFVRDRTGLANDTVIGVAFAGAIGFGAVLMNALGRIGYFNPESFLFGGLLSLNEVDLLFLLALAVVEAALLAVLYNPLVFASFSPSLARSRRVPLRLCSYLFIVLLALIVNLSLRIVGALLINALLVVPAATAGLLARNVRQMFWLTIALSVAVGIGGQLISWEVSARSGLDTGVGGPIVILSVLLFFLAMASTPLLRGRQA